MQLSRHARRRALTEESIIRAAGDLFVSEGYARTSMAAVAERAGVAERTVFLRFASKVELFQRVVEVAVKGDTDDLPLPQREWSVRAMTAPTLDERILAFADGVSEMNERLWRLMAVNGEVEGSEPTVQQSAAVWRRDTSDFLTAFWESAAASGLISPAANVRWLADTTVVLSAAESRLLIARSFGWPREEYRNWIASTWHALAQVTDAPTDERNTGKR